MKTQFFVCFLKDKRRVKIGFNRKSHTRRENAVVINVRADQNFNFT